MATRIQEAGLDPPITEFICQSIRKSSACTYGSMWKSWHSWTSVHGVDRLSPSPSEVTHYLWFLFHDKNLAAATLGVHRAAIGSLVDPLGPGLTESKLITHFMKAAFLNCPSAVRFTWEVGHVFDLLRSWGDINPLTFSQLSWHIFALVWIFSCCRISDMSLLWVDDPFLALRHESATLQAGFGLKQARPGHVSPVICLIKAADETLCPVTHLRAYVAASTAIRSSRNLFVTSFTPHGAAAKAVLKRWFT